jgi:predicted nucleic acid-binding protein
MLDTNAFSDLMKGDGRMLGWLSSLAAPDRVITCTVVRGEILFGLGRLDAGRRRSELEKQAAALFTVVPCEPTPVAAAEVDAELKLRQQRCGLTLNENDLWIAATALATGATLVSRDHDFRSIEGLPMAHL